MNPNSSSPAAVVGAGPNGLAAAVTLARAGVPVTVFEAAETIGGGTRTMDFVEEGVLHDVCSAIHPMALATPFFKEFELQKRVEFSVPKISYANPLDDKSALAFRNIDETVADLGRDGVAYKRFYAPLLARLENTLDATLGGSMLRVPKDPLALMGVGLRTLEQGSLLWNARFKEEYAPALITGVAAHSIGKMPSLATAAVGVVLGAIGHASGWPVPIGGSRAITDALAADLLAHGGTIQTDTPIESLSQLDGFGVVIFDTSAKGFAEIAADRLPSRYANALRSFRYGNAATKVDFVLDGDIPWRDERIAETATVHVGGTRSEVKRAEYEVAKGKHPEKPYVLLAQPTSFDPERNRPGVNAVWSYTHVPKSSTVDMKEPVIKQIERFAPGFRDRIKSVKVTTAHELSLYNRNYHGGDFSAGEVSLKQLISRPVVKSDPWRSPAKGLYIASSSTPPGPGVHGLSGWYAALSALRNEYGLEAPHLGL